LCSYPCAGESDGPLVMIFATSDSDMQSSLPELCFISGADATFTFALSLPSVIVLSSDASCTSENSCFSYNYIEKKT
jgi:hypothetical protein